MEDFREVLLKKQDKIKESIRFSFKEGDIEKDIVNDIEKGKEKIDEQLELGTKIEMEHTKDKNEAMKIAKDHLMENPKYYTEKKPKDWAEKELKKEKKIEKAFEILGCEFEKGKELPEGTIRTHGGKKVQKVGGKWLPMKEKKKEKEEKVKKEESKIKFLKDLPSHYKTPSDSEFYRIIGFTPFFKHLYSQQMEKFSLEDHKTAFILYKKEAEKRYPEYLSSVKKQKEGSIGKRDIDAQSKYQYYKDAAYLIVNPARGIELGEYVY